MEREVEEIDIDTRWADAEACNSPNSPVDHKMGFELGDNVVIQDLSGRLSRLNRSRGRVTGFPRSGTISVYLEKGLNGEVGGTVELIPENIIKVIDFLQSGDEVEIFGMKRKVYQKYNGMRGMILRKEDGACYVAIEGGLEGQNQDNILVRPKNLRLVEAEQSPTPRSFDEDNSMEFYDARAM